MENTITKIKEMKKEDRKITMLTAYDYHSSRLIQNAGIDIVLVGDSLGMVVQGRENTLPVTLEDVIYHTRLVKRGGSEALLVSDLPFMSFQVGVEQALKSAGRLLKEGEAQAVKLEGGKRVVPQVEAMVEAGIPVMGHLGLTPQSVNQFGGFKVQGKQKDRARELIEEARSLEKAGVFSLVLETVPRELARFISEDLSIPVIGIGAGPDCDGQVLVYHDLLGYDQSFSPRFARKYANLEDNIKQAVQKYIADIKEGSFPAEKESFSMEKETISQLEEELRKNED